MSAPVQDDLNGRATYAPTWTRDEQDDDDNRRVTAEIVAAAAERLKAQPSRAAEPHSRQARRDEAWADAAKARPEEEQLDIEDAIRDAWLSSRLEPVRMPPPPKVDGPRWGMLPRLTGAAGSAVVVALFVTGAIPVPSISISFPRDDRASGIIEPAIAKSDAGKQVANLRASSAAQPTFAPRPAPPLPSTVGAAMNVPDASSTPSVQPALRGEPPRPPQATKLSEMESLIARGLELLASGDVAGGRLLLTRAAEAGEARASLALAGSYDAPVMGYLGIVDAAPDPVKARAWYMKAAQQGSPEASRRLQRMAGG
jgi:hypothetical protein